MLSTDAKHRNSITALLPPYLMPPVKLRLLLKESFSIGVILLVSYAVGAVMNAISEVPLLVYTGDYVREGFVFAGTAVAILYVLLRSVALAHTIDTTESHLTAPLREFIREAVVLALPVILWFTIAGLSMVLQSDSTLNSAIETIVLASTRASILTAVLYLLARSGAFLLGSDRGRQRGVPADD